jgi:hypothetical protein
MRFGRLEVPVNEVTAGSKGLNGEGVEIGWEVWAVVGTEGEDMVLQFT